MIVAAALRTKDETIHTARHHANFGDFLSGEQGFINERGEFLSREEAAKHAIECGQTSFKKLKGRKHLNSEDI